MEIKERFFDDEMLGPMRVAAPHEEPGIDRQHIVRTESGDLLIPTRAYGLKASAPEVSSVSQTVVPIEVFPITSGVIIGQPERKIPTAEQPVFP